MEFAELIDRLQQHPTQMRIPASWAQGRASFGGLVAALGYLQMQSQVPAGRPLRSLALTFVGPVEPELEVTFEARVLREGKAVSQVFGQVLQQGQVVTLLQGSFGAARPSRVSLPAEPAPAMKAVGECQELPYLPGVTPAFTQHLAMRWAVGGLPFSNTPSRQMGGWVQLRGEQAHNRLTEAHLLALVDAWPPATLPFLSAPAPGSSLTWTIEFIQPLAELPGNAWCQYLAQIEQAGDGYGHVAAKLWSEEGVLLATSRQVVTVFA